MDLAVTDLHIVAVNNGIKGFTQGTITTIPSSRCKLDPESITFSSLRDKSTYITLAPRSGSTLLLLLVVLAPNIPHVDCLCHIPLGLGVSYTSREVFHF